MTIRTFVLAAVLATASLGAAAQSADVLYVRSLAANCANCHGTNGHAVAGSAVPGLAGMPAATMVQQMQAFRDGTRPATVMHQIAKGFTPAQLELIAQHFAAQKK